MAEQNPDHQGAGQLQGEADSHALTMVPTRQVPQSKMIKEEADEKEDESDEATKPKFSKSLNAKL